MIPKRPYRVLRNLRIDEVSSVDKGAGENVRVLLMKRDDSRATLQRRFDKIFDVKRPFNPGWEKNLDVALDPDDDINPGGEPDNDDDAIAARVAAENDDEPLDDEQQRLLDAMKGQTMLDPMKKLESLDVVQICKAIVAEDRAFSISENALVGLIDKYAKQHGTTFAKLFAAKDDTGLALHKAVSIAKHAGWVSQTATMSKAAASGGAYEQLVAKAEKLRAASSDGMTLAQAFTKIYKDNPQLAAQERAENRPLAS